MPTKDAWMEKLACWRSTSTRQISTHLGSQCAKTKQKRRERISKAQKWMILRVMTGSARRNAFDGGASWAWRHGSHSNLWWKAHMITPQLRFISHINELIHHLAQDAWILRKLFMVSRSKHGNRYQQLKLACKIQLEKRSVPPSHFPAPWKIFPSSPCLRCKLQKGENP